MITFFPLTTERSNAHQGTFSRQVPAWMARAVGGRRALWFATRGEDRAHLLLSDPLPSEVIQLTLAQHGHAWAVVGTSSVDATGLRLSLSLIAAEDGRVVHTTEVAEAVHVDAMRIALQEVAGWLGVEAAPASLPAGWAALSSFLGDLDNTDLATDDRPAHLRRPEDHYVHLIASTLADPAFADAQSRLQRRIEGWHTGGKAALALSAALALARELDDAEAWRHALRLAGTDVAQSEVRLQALRAIARLSESATDALALGVELLQSGAPSEALPSLERAHQEPGTRDAAETYMGVAYASIGEMDKAISYWSRIVRECDDPRWVEIAEENLRRSRPPGPSSDR